MKKYILFCFLCLCLHDLSHAQIYIKGYTGYALSTGNEKLTSYETINNEKYEFSYQWKLGQGVNLGLGIGYGLNKNVAFEITGNTQLFSKFKYSNPYRWDFTCNQEIGCSWYTEGFFGDLEYINTLYQVSPQIVFKSNPHNQCIFYLKGGPDFVWVTHKRTTQTISVVYPIFNTYIPSVLRTTEHSGNINTGIQCSFGTEYKLSKSIYVFAELTAVNVRYTFNHGKILRYEIDGVDSLSELGSTSFDNLDDKVIFNHTGLNVGIKYTFR